MWAGGGFLCFIPRPFLGLSPILHPEVLVVLEVCVCVQGVALPPHFSLRCFPLGTNLPPLPPFHNLKPLSNALPSEEQAREAALGLCFAFPPPSMLHPPLLARGGKKKVPTWLKRTVRKAELWHYAKGAVIFPLTLSPLSASMVPAAK